MGILAGPFVGAAVLLALGGLFKARCPEPTAQALRRSGLGILAPLARLLGGAEVLVGVGALAAGDRLADGLVAAFYVAFTAFVGLNLVRAEGGGCGCFGEAEGRPTAVHLVLNAGGAAVATAVALGSGGGLTDALRHQPLAGVPFLLLVVVATGLAYAAMTILPPALSSLSETRP